MNRVNADVIGGFGSSRLEMWDPDASAVLVADDAVRLEAYLCVVPVAGVPPQDAASRLILGPAPESRFSRRSMRRSRQFGERAHLARRTRDGDKGARGTVTKAPSGWLRGQAQKKTIIDLSNSLSTSRAKT
jgi:hypothetical protein